jgi:hypothetical protein
MCSSESEADPPSQPSSLPGPALRTRKRSGDSSFNFSDGHDIGEEDEDNNNYPDSDDDFVIEKKKKKVEKKKRKAKTSNDKKPSQGLNNSNTSKSSSVSDISIPPDAEKSNLTIEVMLKKEESSNHEEGFPNNLGVARPVTIATPDQINSRSFDQEEVMTPSSCSTPMEENIAQKLVDQVLQVQTPVNPILKTSEELNMKTLPKPCFSSQHTDSTSRLAQQPGQSQVANPNVPVGHGRGFRPAPPFRPGQARQPRPGTRPPVRPSGPRMLKPVRPSIPPKYAAYRPSQAVPRPSLVTGGPRLPNIRSSNHIKHRSLSTPQYSSQYNPPVIELDVSPPRSADLVSHPPTNSVVNKLTSMGLSVAMEKVPSTKHGWVLPPGLSVTRTPSSTGEEDSSKSLPILAKALLQLGEVRGSKRLVQFKLTESQVSALQALGVREDLG